MDYPEITEGARVEVENLLAKFKRDMKRIAEDAISPLYTDISPHIETDHWTNLRTAILNDLAGYSKLTGIDRDRILAGVWKNHSEEIRNDKIAELEKQVSQLHDSIDRMNRVY